MRQAARHTSILKAARLGVVAAMLAGVLAGCNTTTSDSGPPVAGAPGGRIASAPLAAPPVDMTGRWVLASPNRGFCNMTFGAPKPGTAEGTIAPEGGCPGAFFTSRKWVFEQSGLVMRNHKGDPLAQLAVTSSGRLEGQATGGEQVSLSR